MSSNYHPICLSHDRALVIDKNLSYDEAKAFADRDSLDGHQRCDIVVGRFSYPLIEVACLGRQLPGPTGCKSRHGSIEWIDSDWLRLLYAATPHVDTDVLRRHAFGCWTPERLHRLRDELGLPEPRMPAPDLGLDTLREVLDTFAVVSSAGRLVGYAGPEAVAPEDFERWHTALGSAPWPNLREAK